MNVEYIINILTCTFSRKGDQSIIPAKFLSESNVAVNWLECEINIIQRDSYVLSVKTNDKLSGWVFMCLRLRLLEIPLETLKVTGRGMFIDTKYFIKAIYIYKSPRKQ